MLNVIHAKCCKQAFYTECHYTKCRYAKCRYSECHGNIFVPFVTKTISQKIHFCDFYWFLLQHSSIGTKQSFLMFLYKDRCAFICTPYTGNPYWRGRLSIVDLFALTSLDQLLLILQTLFLFLQNKLALWGGCCTEPFLQFMCPALCYTIVSSVCSYSNPLTFYDYASFRSRVKNS